MIPADAAACTLVHVSFTNNSRHNELLDSVMLNITLFSDSQSSVSIHRCSAHDVMTLESMGMLRYSQHIRAAIYYLPMTAKHRFGRFRASCESRAYSRGSVSGGRGGLMAPSCRPVHN